MKMIADDVKWMISRTNRQFPSLECCEVVQQGVDNFQR